MGASSVSPARTKNRGQSPLDSPPTRNRTQPDALEAVRNIFDKALRFQLDGRIDLAVQHYERALILKPDYAEAHNNLGVALAKLGRFKDAIAHYERAITLERDYADAYINLGVARMAQGMVGDAVACFETALGLNPDHAGAHYSLGLALGAQGKTCEAAAHYERAVILKPDWADAHNNLGNLRGAQGNPDGAAAHYLQALAIDPDHAEAHNNLGNNLLEEGKFDDALAHYDCSIAVNPANTEAHYHRAQIKTFRRDDADLAVLKALAEGSDLPPNRAAFAHFALAKAFEDMEDHARAFAHLRKGNDLKRSQIHYDEAAVLRGFQRTSAAFDRRLLERLYGAGDPSPAPIFVLGMPRSGSTLIEQILASHPGIYGAGELTALPAAINAAVSAPGWPVPYPECVPALGGAALRRMGRDYLARLPAVPNSQIRIVDKCPGNFLNIGLIRLILPNARIIHTTRDPIDTCLSCYSSLFKSGVLFGYDLAESGRYYRAYREVMIHWRSVLPADAILDVSYEDVVNDLGGQARRLVDYCGLPWDERCLSFNKTDRPVRTASAVQVRQPLFRSSLQRWRKYEADLGPLLHELGDIAHLSD
jgi:tetratricopeptide (TPR) repeat protein